VAVGRWETKQRTGSGCHRGITSPSFFARFS
jgi:hypothetical protein